MDSSHARGRRQLRLHRHRPDHRARGRAGGADGAPARGDRARGPQRALLVRDRRAPPQRVLRLRTAGHPGRGRRPDRADPARQRRGGAERGRPGAPLPAVRDPGPDLEGPDRPRRRPRLVHRGLPAVRARPRRLRLALHREARAAPADPRPRRGHLVRPAPAAAGPPARLPAPGPGPAADLGRRGRHAGVVRARRAARPAADGRDHRRRAAPVRAARRSLPPRRRRGRTPAGAAAGGPARLRLRRREHRGGRGHDLPRLARDVHEGLPRARLRGRRPGSSSTPPPGRTAPSSWATRRRSPTRSAGSPSSSAASTGCRCR